MKFAVRVGFGDDGESTELEVKSSESELLLVFRQGCEY